MYELMSDSLVWGHFPTLQQAKEEAWRLSGMALLFDATVVNGTPMEWRALYDGHRYTITLMHMQG